VLSTYIDAEARRIVAFGDYLESAAIARRINVESDRIAMENSLRWVEVYFQRKQLNRQYRREMNPIYIDKQQRRDEMKKRIIARQPEEALDGDLTDDLNWLLDRLVTDQSTYQFVFNDRDDEAAELDRELTDDQISHIRLREATGQQGSGQSFRADAARLLHQDWPVSLNRDEFQLEKRRYEAARDLVLREVGTSKLSFATWDELQAAHQAISDKFDAVYSPKNMRNYDGNERIDIRRTGDVFLKAQAAAIAQAFVADNRDLFEGKYLFKGDSLIALVRHCADNGIEFAKPEVDDRATYRTLFTHLRAVYLHFHPNEVSE
jgi:hypothetical protein